MLLFRMKNIQNGLYDDKGTKSTLGCYLPLKMHFKDVCDFLYKPTNNVGNVVNLVRSDNMELEK